MTLAILSLVLNLVFAPAPLQGGKDSPEPTIRALVLAIYGNDVAAYNSLTMPHPLRSRLTAGGRVNAEALRI